MSAQTRPPRSGGSEAVSGERPEEPLEEPREEPPGGTSDASADEGRAPELMTRAEVAALFGVSPRTVTGWANDGRLESIRTLGGHRRYASDEVRTLLDRQRRLVVEEDRSRPEDGRLTAADVG